MKMTDRQAWIGNGIATESESSITVGHSGPNICCYGRWSLVRPV